MKSAEATPEELLSDGCLTVAGAVQFSGIGRSMLYRLMAAGELRYLNHGARRLIPRRELVRVLRADLAATQEGGAR